MVIIGLIITAALRLTETNLLHNVLTEKTDDGLIITGLLEGPEHQAPPPGQSGQARPARHWRWSQWR